MLKTISSIVNAIGALNYKGTWNASTNTPTLASGVGTKGDYYVVSVAGSTNLDGETLWGVGDWAVFNGSIWQKVDGGSTGNFTSVNTGTLDVTGNTTLGDASTDTVRVNGYMGVGGAVNAQYGVIVSSAALSGTSQIGAGFFPVATSAATSAVRGISVTPATAAASFTVGEATGALFANVSKGAGSTITSQRAIYILDQTNGTNNYGIESQVSSGANKYNIYASGTAQNYFAGDVGIGTTSPANRLDIVNSASSAQMSIAGSDGQFAGMFGGTGSNGPGIFFLNTAPALRFGTATTKALGSFAELMRLTAGGSLGLGVTPSAWGAGNKALEQIGGSLFSGAIGNIYLGNNTYFDGTNWIYKNTAAASYYQQGAGAHYWFQAASGTAGNTITFTERMRLDASGNLGVGTSSPGQRLDVDGNIQVRSTNSINFFTTGYFIRASTGLELQSADSIRFLTNGANERMRLDSSGNLGLGTASPSAKLHVAGTNTGSTFIGGIFSNEGLTAGSTVRINFLSGEDGTVGRTRAIIEAVSPAANDGALVFQTRSAGSVAERMRLTAGGNLGLGVTPSAWFASSKVIQAGPGASISSRSNTIVEITSNAFLNTSGSWTYQNTGEATLYAGAGGLHRWSIAPSGTAGTAITFTQAMTLDTSGNLGIGTTSPVNKLQVVGSFGRGAPVTKTGNFTLADTENWIICNGTGTITVTLPAASSWTGREFTIKTIAAFTVISNASNVVPLAGGAAGTAILAATAGTWATLVSDGTNWIIMQA